VDASGSQLVVLDPQYKDFRVSAAGWGDNGIWVTVVHTPCGATVFGGQEEDPDATDVAELVFVVQAHRCTD
jgi:hypothetical protein